MAEQQIRFDDGAAYEDFMGGWSRLAGESFLDWLGASRGLRWLDVGCGNGAFTQLLVERCAAAEVLGVDPSQGQLAFARERLAGRRARFEVGDAMALPVADGAVDAAVMALVIFFVPEPARGVAEMVRALVPGGGACAYAWDLMGGGFPYAALQQEMAALGQAPLMLPSADAGSLDRLRALWTQAGLVDVETHRVEVERTFPDFDSFWAIAQKGPRTGPQIAGLGEGGTASLRERLRARLVTSPDGRVTIRAWANAIRGRKPR